MPAYKYSFKAPAYQELKIQDEKQRLIGELRLKPSSILWKPANAQKYYAVPLDVFREWIEGGNSGAKRTKQ
jgi:hypothetical protein